MKFELFLSALVLNGVCVSFTSAFQPITAPSQNQSRRLDRAWSQKYVRGLKPTNQFRRDFWKDPGDTDSDEDTSTESSSSSGTAKGMDGMQIPKVNFYTSVPSGMGVIGQGILFLREISAAIGTPLPMWILTIPLVILGVGTMFLPDLTGLNIPGFYPNGGGDKDPLAAFPPLFAIEGLKDLDFIQKAAQLLPPQLLKMKRG